jgi:hypothetical protein
LVMKRVSAQPVEGEHIAPSCGSLREVPGQLRELMLSPGHESNNKTRSPTLRRRGARGSWWS